MKKGICWGCLPGGSAEEKFKLAKDAGYDGVEIGAERSRLQRGVEPHHRGRGLMGGRIVGTT